MSDVKPGMSSGFWSEKGGFAFACRGSTQLLVGEASAGMSRPSVGG